MIAFSAVIKQFVRRFYAFFENRTTKIAAPLTVFFKGPLSREFSSGISEEGYFRGQSLNLPRYSVTPRDFDKYSQFCMPILTKIVIETFFYEMWSVRIQYII